jgi:hypothetical protein
MDVDPALSELSVPGKTFPVIIPCVSLHLRPGKKLILTQWRIATDSLSVILTELMHTVSVVHRVRSSPFTVQSLSMNLMFTDLRIIILMTLWNELMMKFKLKMQPTLWAVCSLALTAGIRGIKPQIFRTLCQRFHMRYVLMNLNSGTHLSVLRHNLHSFRLPY